MLLVMGNEGYGLRTNGAREQLSLQTPQSSIVDSLHVSIATGVLLHRLASISNQLRAWACCIGRPPVLFRRFIVNGIPIVFD